MYSSWVSGGPVPSNGVILQAWLWGWQHRYRWELVRVANAEARPRPTALEAGTCVQQPCLTSSPGNCRAHYHLRTNVISCWISQVSFWEKGRGPGRLWGLPAVPDGACCSVGGVSGDSGRRFQGGLKDGSSREGKQEQMIHLLGIIVCLYANILGNKTGQWCPGNIRSLCQAVETECYQWLCSEPLLHEAPTTWNTPHLLNETHTGRYASFQEHFILHNMFFFSRLEIVYKKSAGI